MILGGIALFDLRNNYLKPTNKIRDGQNIILKNKFTHRFYH